MKKLLRKRSMLLVALLVGLCMPVAAQETVPVTSTKDFVTGDPISGDIGDGTISYSAETGASVGEQDFSLVWASYVYLEIPANKKLIISANNGALIESIEFTLGYYNGGIIIPSREYYSGGTRTVAATKGGENVECTMSPKSGQSSGKFSISTSGGADVVTLTVGSQLRIISMTVTYKAILEEPTISVTSAAGTELTKGQVTILETTSNSTGTVSYTSSNTSVATVSSLGVVSTVGTGEVTLTASVAAAGRFKAGSASIKITVKEPEPDPNAWTADDLLTIPGVVPVADGKTMYYLKNVGTGLNINYGGEWGTHCIESQSAHPIVLEDNGDGTFAIGSIYGYLESNSLWMDFHKNVPDKTTLTSEEEKNKYASYETGTLTSRWTLVPVEGYENQYYIVGDYERYLSSVGNRSGLLVLKSNEGKAFQRWIFTTDDDVMGSLMSEASTDLPIDATSLIKGASFDLVDDEAFVSGRVSNSFSDIVPYANKHWTNYTSQEGGIVTRNWNRVMRTWNPEEYNCCTIFRNLKNSNSVGYSMTLPAGAYRFTFEGFYQRSNGGDLTASVQVLDSDGNKSLGTVQLPKNSKMTYVALNDYWNSANTAPAVLFRDGDEYLKEITFFLSTVTNIKIQVAVASNSDNLIYLDNFNLYYTGFPSVAPTFVGEPVDLSAGGYTTWLVYDEESQGYICYSDAPFADYLPYVDSYFGVDVVEIILTNKADVLNKKAVADKEYQIYEALSDASDAVIDAALAAADDNIIYKNYLNANINAYKELLNDAGKEEFISKLEELQVYPDNINSRLEYYDAIAKLEEAFEYAKIADAKGQNPDEDDDIIDYSGAIYNPSFEFGDLYNHGEARGWTIAEGYTGQTWIAQNADKAFTTKGIDGACLFNNWWTGTHLTQTVTDLPAGTYILSALVASNDANNIATIYLTGNDRKRGVNPPNIPYITIDKDADGKEFSNHRNNAAEFGDFSLKVIVPNTSNGKGSATVGIIGGNDDDTPENPIGSYNANGHWWYKCDNFRLEYLPNGRLPLRDEDTKIKNLIDPFDGVDVTRSINKGYWSTLVLPFDMPCPTDWEVETLNVVDQYDGDIRLTFTAIDKSQGLKAGVPYIVRVGEALSTISANNVNVNTTLLIPAKKTSAEYDVEFVPVYTNGFIPASELQKDGNGELVKDGNNEYIPTGTQYYFINGSGKLKRCVYENYNAIKGFRAYFKVTPKTAEARNALRSLSMRTSEETDIENVATEEVKVIGIYDVNGIRLSEMKPGINILRMNNGTTKKVMVK